MLTIFGLPKPFQGHIGVIQRNAITSWTCLRPQPEVILFHKEEGTEEVARELGVRYVPDVRCNEFGTPLLDDMFAKAREMATHPIMCYANADMLFLSDFMNAVERVASWRNRFLMAGRRTYFDLDELVDFETPDWEVRLRALVSKQGVLGPPNGIDYFVFPQNLELNMPPFAIGRPYWDNWFLWKARSLKIAVVDASRIVLAIHQNHDYAHNPQGIVGIFRGEEGQGHLRMVGRERMYTVDDATHVVTPEGIKGNGGRLFLQIIKRQWAALMRKSMPIRHRLGIRRDRLERLASLFRETGDTRK
jgi:hypothetical protein